MKRTHTILAVSGGVDSLLAMALLVEAEEPVIAVHGQFLQTPTPEASRLQERRIRILQLICQDMGVPLHVLDCVEAFTATIAEPFVRSYLRGETPNPCCRCNPAIKFGLLFDRARALVPDTDPFFATGHYARLVDHPRWGRILKRPLDDSKDQSYFLALLPKNRLTRARFPLAEIRKADVPGMLRERGLRAPENKESQEICFIPDNDYRAFIQAAVSRMGLPLPGPGPVLHTGGELLGRHQGLWRYTQGQRRGLGIAHHEPLYVLGKDVRQNALIVGAKSDFGGQECLLREPNFHVPMEQWPTDIVAQIRYRQTARPVVVSVTEHGLRVGFPEIEPDTPPAPGQLCAIYTPEGELLAGGDISRPLLEEA